MSERHRRQHVSPRTERRRHPRKLTAEQSAIGKRMRDQGYSFEAIAEALGAHRDAVLAASGKWRDMEADSGRGVLNVDPEDRDTFRQEHCLPGEAIRPAFKRHLAEHNQLLAWAKATGFPGFDSQTGGSALIS